MKRGFSLVELSIVLVILGLLTGGILAGQSLIRAAELRSIVSDQQRYFTAIRAFRDKYMAMPGDMNNATRFWGDDATRCADGAIANGTPGTCNGNGDGNIDLNQVENYLGWQHLSLSGLIEGSFNGFVPSAVNTYSPVIGTEVPASKISNAYWQLVRLSQLSTVNSELGFSGVADIRSQYLILSNKMAGWWSNPNLLLPEEAWNVDVKMDDGVPATGVVRSSNWGAVGISCLTGLTAAASYNVSGTSKLCLLGFIHQ